MRNAVFLSVIAVSFAACQTTTVDTGGYVRVESSVLREAPVRPSGPWTLGRPAFPAWDD